MSLSRSLRLHQVGHEVWESVNQVFDALPLAAIVDNSIFCVHGGIPAPSVLRSFCEFFSFFPRANSRQLHFLRAQRKTCALRSFGEKNLFFRTNNRKFFPVYMEEYLHGMPSDLFVRFYSFFFRTNNRQIHFLRAWVKPAPSHLCVRFFSFFPVRTIGKFISSVHRWIPVPPVLKLFCEFFS